MANMETATPKIVTRFTKLIAFPDSKVIVIEPAAVTDDTPTLRIFVNPVWLENKAKRYFGFGKGDRMPRIYSYKTDAPDIEPGEVCNLEWGTQLLRPEAGSKKPVMQETTIKLDGKVIYHGMIVLHNQVDRKGRRKLR